MHDITQLWGMCIIGKEEEEEEDKELSVSALSAGGSYDVRN